MAAQLLSKAGINTALFQVAEDKEREGRRWRRERESEREREGRKRV